MATTSPFGPANPHSFVPPPLPDAAAGPGLDRPTDADPLDADLIQETKNQIRSLVQEISGIAQSEIGVDAFHDEFLRRVVTAMACVGGAIWTFEQGEPRLANQINLARTELAQGGEAQARHQRLLEQAVRTERPTIVPPLTDSSSGAAGNPTSCVLVIACFQIDDQQRGLVEIFQRAGGGPATQRGYLRFVVQMCEFATQYYKNRRLRDYADREALWHALEQFLGETHRSLDPRSVAFAIANEGRRLIECDRLTVAVRRRGSTRILAVSGVESVERKSQVMASLESLITRVVATRRPFWMLPGGPAAPPQIEQPLHAYLDQSHATALAVIPLLARSCRPEDSGDSQRDSTRERPTCEQSVIGAVVCEQIRQTGFTPGMVERVKVLGRHSELALGNALELSSLFLLPVWRGLGQVWGKATSRLPLIALVTAAAAILVMGLALWPASFLLSAPGKLRPVERRNVFAQVDGSITEVLVRHGGKTTAGQPLLRMHSIELEVAISELLGQKNKMIEQIDSKEQLLLKNARLDPIVQDEIAGDLYELKQALESTEQRLALLREKANQLTIVSPMNGQVVTWQVDDTLLRRPVSRGQALLTVVNPDGPWELELHVAERRLGHLLAARRESDGRLPVRFQLKSLPGQEFEGEVVEIEHVAEVRAESGNSVAVRVAIDKSQIPQLHNDTSVDGRILCGRRALGYVLFHDVIETVRSNWLYWF